MFGWQDIGSGTTISIRAGVFAPKPLYSLYILLERFNMICVSFCPGCAHVCHKSNITGLDVCQWVANGFKNQNPGHSVYF